MVHHFRFISISLFAVILLCSLSFVTVTSAEGNNGTPNSDIVQSYADIKYAYLLGNFSDPITIEEVNEATKAVLDSYREDKENASERLIYPVEENSAEDIILAYCFKIDGNGITSSYVGKTGETDENHDNRTIARIHCQAEEWYANEVLGTKTENQNLSNYSAEIAKNISAEDNFSGNKEDTSILNSEDKQNIPAPRVLTTFVLIFIAYLAIKKE